MPCTASGLLPSVPGTGLAGSGWVQVWVIVSGLYWKTITFGSGMGRNVGMNSTSAPFSTKPLTVPPPRPGRPVPGHAPAPVRSRRRCAAPAGPARPGRRRPLPPRSQRVEAGGPGRAEHAGRQALGDQPRERARGVLVEAGYAQHQPVDVDVTGRAAGRRPPGLAAGLTADSIWPGRTTTPCFSSSRRAAASTWRSVIGPPSPRARNAAASAADLMPAPVRSSSRARRGQSSAPMSGCPARRARPRGRSATAARARPRSGARSR